MPDHSKRHQTFAIPGRPDPRRGEGGRFGRRCAEARFAMDDADVRPFRGRLLHCVRRVAGAPV